MLLRLAHWHMHTIKMMNGSPAFRNTFGPRLTWFTRRWNVIVIRLNETTFKRVARLHVQYCLCGKKARVKSASRAILLMWQQSPGSEITAGAHNRFQF